MAKYHVNPEKGPLICTASSPDKCLYGSDAPHFETKSAAKEFHEQEMIEKFGTIPANTKRRSRTAIRNDFFNDFESQSTEDIIEFANNTVADHRHVDKVINERVDFTKARSAAIARAEANGLLDAKILNSHKREFDDYRNRTAELVEAYSESRFYKPATYKWESYKVNDAIILENHPSHSRGWYESRYNSVGGSDVGTIASLEFEDNPPGYVKGNYGKVVKSKTIPMTDSDFQEESYASRVKKSGAMYRGTIWEERIRNDYAKEHPDRKVYTVDGQLSHPEREWQKVNIDGLISDREDGVPNGILEIKTGSNAKEWKNGVPVNYRAQTLYYLNTTGLGFADVRAVINDSEVYEYRLYKDDEVAPGCGFNMEDYVNKRIEPWFEDMKSKRSN